LIEAVRNPRNHRYSMSRGIPRLRAEIVKRYRTKYGVELDSESEAIVTIGAKDALAHLLFAVIGPGGERTIAGDEPVRWETDFGAAELTHLNLYDRTVEGLRLPDAGASTVQYHPEAGPGPHDALHLFDRFIGEIRA